MEHRLTCPHCENNFRLQYLERKHPVDVAVQVPCPHCHAPVPNPGPPDATAAAERCAVRIVAIRDPRSAAWEHGIRWGMVQTGVVCSHYPEWVLAAAMAAILTVYLHLGRQISDEAAFSGFVFLPFLVLSVYGLQRMRVRISPQPNLLRSVVQVAGMLSAGMLVLLTLFMVAGR